MSMQDYLNELTNRRTWIESSEKRANKMVKNSQLTARDRVFHLLDDYSFVEMGAFVKPRNTDYNLKVMDTPADGVITGYGTINGKLVYVYAQDAAVVSGALGEMHAEKIVRVYEQALKVGAPVIGLLDSVGMRLQEGLMALQGYGKIFAKQSAASGVILQISALFGTCGGGAAMLPSLSDFVLMTKENASYFLNSANALLGSNKVESTLSDAAFHHQKTGLCDLVYDNDKDLIEGLRNLVSLFPSNHLEEALLECTDDLNRLTTRGLEACEKDFDMNLLVQEVFDEGSSLVLKAAYGTDVITAIGSLGGHIVGIIANDATKAEGRLTLEGAKKISEFVTKLDAFSIPIITFVDLVGYSATLNEEASGQARVVAKMISAFSSATVPKICLVTGQAMGAAFVAMNSKTLGADVVYAYPNATIMTMDPEHAVKIMYASEVKAMTISKAQLAQEISAYKAKYQGPYEAASLGLVDDIIDPAATRKRLIAACEMLYSKYIQNSDRKHLSI